MINAQKEMIPENHLLPSSSIKMISQNTKCGRCKLQFSSYDDYIGHSCSESNPNVFQCHICKRTDIPFSMLKGHIHLLNSDSANDKINNESMKTANQDSEFPCLRCEKKFISLKKLQWHACVDGKFVCSDCGKIFNHRHLFKRHCMTHSNELFKCQYCYTSFIKKKSIERHVLKFNCSKGARNFWFSTYDTSLCRVCHSKFSDDLELLKHFASNHTGNPHKCKWCDKELSTRNDFAAHVLFHNIEKYTCVTCEKAYTSHEGYRRHKLKHRDAEHKCKHCGSEFLSRKRAEIHVEKCKKKKRLSQTTKPSRQLHWKSEIIVKKVRGVEAEDASPPIKETTLNDDDDDSLSDRRGWFDNYFNDFEETNVSDDDRPVNDNLVEEAETTSSENSSDESGDEVNVKIDFNYKTCRLCGINFQLEYELLHHFVRLHTGEVPHKCPDCEVTAPLFAQLKEHMKTHGVGLGVYHCGFCSKAFRTESRRQRHTTKCLGDVTGGPSTKQCRRCNKVFHTKCGYKRHKITSCKREKKVRVPADDVASISDPEVETFEPEVNQPETTKEIATSEPVPIEADEEISEPRKSKEEIVYKVLNTEKDVNDGRSNFPCRLCDERFSFERGLVFHFKEKHPGIKPLICPHCGVALADKLKEHLKTHGIGEEFLCELCPKKFNQKFMSKIHELWHQGIEYKCENCKQKFLNEEKMQKHVNSGKCTNRRSLMKLPCEICGRYYKSNFGLQNHYLTHTPRDLRPFKRRMNCEFCGKWFETNNALVRHRRIHTGEKPFCCRYCPRTFAQDGNCKVHEKTHTGESKPRRKRGEKLAEQPTMYIYSTISEGVQ